MKKPKLKGLDWKQFLVNHGEKLIFGIVALCGLAALGMSRWAPYNEKNPFTLNEDVEKAKEAHKVSTWPETEQTKFTTDQNIFAKAENLLSPLPESQFAFSATLPGMTWPVIPKQQPIDEPTWYPVEKLIADSGVVLYQKAPDFESLLGESEATEAAEETPAPPTQVGQRRSSDFSPRQPTTGVGEEGYGSEYGVPGAFGPPGAGRGGAAAGRGGAAAGRGGAAGGRGGAAAGRGGAAGGRGGAAGGRGGAAGGRGGAAGGRGGASSAMAGMEMGMEGYDMEGYGMMTGPVEAEAKRYVSVRGVYPIRSQERELARALNAQSTAQVMDALQFVDFELERQVAQAGDDPWSGAWEKVDIKVANDVLTEAAFFEADVVDPTVASPVFTMPLPGRLAGQWDQYNASHPALTKFDLDPAAKEKMDWLNARIAEYAKQNEELLKEQVQIGGFASQTYDTAKIGRQMMSDAGAMQELTGMGGMPYPGAAGVPGQQKPPEITKEDLKAFVTASGTYLLFRYIDFDVQPGNAYRYRVRLTVLNPSYGLEAGEVAHTHVAEGKTRTTDWSEPSPPSIVPRDTKYYVGWVGKDGRSSTERAWFRLFEWSEEVGMIVSANLPVEPAQFIGGTQQAEVIDPAASTFETRDYKFTSGDMLVDVDNSPSGLAKTLPELGLHPKFNVPPQVLVVNDWGGLEVQDALSVRPEMAERDAFVKGIAEDFSYLKAPVTTDETGLDYEGTEGMSGEEGMGGGRGPGGRKGNPLRRGRGSSSSSGA